MKNIVLWAFLSLSLFLFLSCILDNDGHDGGYDRRSSSSSVDWSARKSSMHDESSSENASSSSVNKPWHRSSSATSPSSSSAEFDVFPTWNVPFKRTVDRGAEYPLDQKPDPRLAALGRLQLSDIVSGQDWENLFPYRAGIQRLCHGDTDIYSYEAFMEAAESFPAFAAEGPDSVRIREVAAFLANISHETTGGSGSYAPGSSRYFWGLCWTEELSYAGSTKLGYRDEANSMYPAVSGVSYHGRGPIQLTWNYNYGAFGEELALPLLRQPQLVSEDGVIAFQSALWFWMKEQYPKPSPHDAIIEVWEPSAADQRRNRWPGFGVTINIINGGGECGIGSDKHPGPPDRIGYFGRYTDYLGTSVGRNVGCLTQRDFTFQ